MTKKPMQYTRGLDGALTALRKHLGSKPLFLPPTRRSIPMRHLGIGKLLAGESTPGLPTGSFIEVLGNSHSGKTSFAFACADAVVNQSPNVEHTILTENGVETVPPPRRVLYIDFEHALDLRYLRSSIRNCEIAETDTKGKLLNAATANVWVHQPDTLEEGGDIMLHLIASGEFGLVVLDSVAAMLSEEERLKPMGENTVGRQAQAMGKFLRKSAHMVSRYGVVVVLVNQWRDKIGVAFGDPRTAPGGKAIEYYDAIKIDISGPKKTPWFPDDGKIVNVKTMKNKVTGVKGLVTTHLKNGWGISAEVELTELAEMAGLIRRSKQGYALKVKGGKIKTYSTVMAWLEALHTRPDLFRSVQAAVARSGVTIKHSSGQGWE